MQRRYFNYGTDATASLFKEMLEGLTGPSVLSGADLSVSGNDRLVVGPFWAAVSSPHSTMLGIGRTALLVNETENTTLLFPTTTAPADYTVVLNHDDVDVVGGAAATVTLQPGLITTESLVNGVVLAWVKYPGGSVPLALRHMIGAPKHRLEAVSTPGDGQYLVAPFHSMMVAHRSGTSTAVVTNGVEHATVGPVLQLDNIAGVDASQDYLRWEFVAGTMPPASITVDWVSSTSTSMLSLDVQDTEKNFSSATYTIPGGQYLAGMLVQDYPDVALETYPAVPLTVLRKRLRISNGTFRPGKRFRVQATIQTTNGARSYVVGAGHSTYRKPFAA